MMDKRLRLLVIAAILLAILCGENPYRYTASAFVEDDQYDMLLPLALGDYNFGPGEVSGRVIDAANGRGLQGVSICLNPQECATTNHDGLFTTTTFPGDRQLTASLTGYYPVVKDVFVLGGDNVELNYALSPYITGGNIELRAVLTWDSAPYWPPDQVENDLDAHLWLEAILPVHVYFDNKGDCTTYPNACLETDFRTGFGPETLAVRQFEPDTVYYFGILNYNQGTNGVPSIIDTGAHLEVYDETGVVASYDVANSQGDGNFWYTFTYTYSPQQGSWVLTPKNCIVYYSSDIQDIIDQCP
jgi:hypothetical protein